jgi:virginiamycin A acetyltransferase
MSIRKIHAKIIRIFEYALRHKNFIALTGSGKISNTVLKHNCSIFGDVQIGEGCKIIDGVSIKTSSKIEIGRYTSINGPNTDLFSAINKIKIGNFCSVARNVSMQEFNHNFDCITSYHIQANIFKKEKKYDIYSNGNITIGNDVWIGTQSVILSGSEIGNGAIIAANSVVNGIIPPYAIAAGSPAKVLKYRFEKEIIDQLEKIEWWNWSLEKIKQNKDLFEGKLTLDKLHQIINTNS